MAAAAEAEAAEALIPSKVQAMEAEGHPAWKVQAMEVEEREKILSLIRTKIQELHMENNKDLSSLSEAEREARKAEAKAERSSLKRAFVRVGSGIRTPDYSGMTEAERAAEAVRLRQEKLEEARRLKAEGDDDWWVEERIARITDFDPKQYGMYYNRIMSLYCTEKSFDIDQESPLGPMRFTDKVYGKDRPQLCRAMNILSVNIACSDVGFPIQVYGSVIARDSIDRKCIYLFRRDRDHCQFISSKDEPLILTGPKRGLVLSRDNYVETDLKIKDDHLLGQEREFSKGVLLISAVRGRSLEESEVQRYSIATRLSTVDVLYAAVKRAVEGTFEIIVLHGRFYGTITAHITSVQDHKIMLYDSKVVRANKPHRRARGVIQLMRSVVCVPVRDMLIIDAKTSAGKYACLKFNPKYNGREGVVITLGDTKMHVKLAWSVMVDR